MNSEQKALLTQTVQSVGPFSDQLAEIVNKNWSLNWPGDLGRSLVWSENGYRLSAKGAISNIWSNKMKLKSLFVSLALLSSASSFAGTHFSMDKKIKDFLKKHSDIEIKLQGELALLALGAAVVVAPSLGTPEPRIVYRDYNPMPGAPRDFLKLTLPASGSLDLVEENNYQKIRLTSTDRATVTLDMLALVGGNEAKYEEYRRSVGTKNICKVFERICREASEADLKKAVKWPDTDADMTENDDDEGSDDSDWG